MKYILGIIAALVIIGGLYLGFGRPEKMPSDMNVPQDDVVKKEPTEGTIVPPTTNVPATTNTTGSTTSTAKTYTMADVTAHNSVTSCYSAINGIVYDLTNWIGRHPGGQQEILSICGKDGSSAFTGKHGGEMRPEQILAGFKIGELVK